MDIRLKNRSLNFFMKRPGTVLTCMFIVVVSLVIMGASQKKVTILDGGNKTETVTYEGTVKDVLEQNKIKLNPKDKILPELESVIKDGDKIVIRRAVPVTVVMDGKTVQYMSAEETVEDMLAAEGITYETGDKVYPEVDSAVSNGMEVRIVRVTQKEINEKEVFAYTTEIKQMPEWEAGVEKLIRNGSNGEKQTTVKITYEDGVEKKREIVGEKIIKPAISQLLAVGTMDTKIVSRGETIKFKKMMVMRATSYTDDIACTGKIGGNTATGTKPRRIPGGGKWSTVAVDPKIIPLGTKMWIEGYGFGIAEDTGGGVKGNIIDLFFTSGSQEYERWSTRKVRVYILK